MARGGDTGEWIDRIVQPSAEGLNQQFVAEMRMKG